MRQRWIGIAIDARQVIGRHGDRARRDREHARREAESVIVIGRQRAERGQRGVGSDIGGQRRIGGHIRRALHGGGQRVGPDQACDDITKRWVGVAINARGVACRHRERRRQFKHEAIARRAKRARRRGIVKRVVERIAGKAVGGDVGVRAGIDQPAPGAWIEHARAHIVDQRPITRRNHDRRRADAAGDGAVQDDVPARSGEVFDDHGARGERRKDHVAAGGVGHARAVADGEAHRARSRIDCCGLQHRRARRAMSVHNARAGGFVGHDGESAIVGVHRCVEDHGAPGLQRKIAAIAAAIVDHKARARIQRNVVARLQHHVHAV